MNKLLVIGVLLAVCLGLGVGLYFGFAGSDDDESTECPRRVVIENLKYCEFVFCCLSFRTIETEVFFEYFI